MSDHLQKYVDYLQNTGQGVLLIADFDDDWEPIGPMLRKQLLDAGLTEEWGGGMALKLPTPKGTPK